VDRCYLVTETEIMQYQCQNDYN